MGKFTNIDLILNKDGSTYHLHVLPDEIAGNIITVGDPARVGKISRYFDKVEARKENREFITHTGWLGGKRYSVISTGIGTDNIDIVLNELDALVNIDLAERVPKQKLTSLNIIRFGTSGALQADIEAESVVVSSAAIGLDSLMHYYERQESDREKAILLDLKSKVGSAHTIYPYVAESSSKLLQLLADGYKAGVTLTTPGFFAPQGRKLRAAPAYPGLIELLAEIEVAGEKITNFEMETAGIYGLAKCLGHHALSFSVILPNRATGKISGDPEKAVNKRIEEMLSLLTAKL